MAFKNKADYLKRHLLCLATLKVIERRLEQSNALLFLCSNNSINSIWCKYELNYFYSLEKPIYTISSEDVDNSIFSYRLDTDTWFLDKNYKSLVVSNQLKH